MSEANERHAARWMAAAVALAAVIVASLTGISDPKLCRAAIVAGVVLVLWLSEVIPLYATTIVLWVGCVLLLSPTDPANFALPRVLSKTRSDRRLRDRRGSGCQFR